MGEDLGLDIGDRYTVALVVFFPPYVIFEVRKENGELGASSDECRSFLRTSFSVRLGAPIGLHLLPSHGDVSCSDR
jgi:hypothetical protein